MYLSIWFSYNKPEMIHCISWVDQKNSVRGGGGGGGGVLTMFFSHQCILQWAIWTSRSGPIAYQGGSVPVFLRKPIATCCDFSGVGPEPLSPPPVPHLDLPMYISSGQLLEFPNSFSKDCFYFDKPHFVLIFTVCKIICLGVFVLGVPVYKGLKCWS